MKCKIGVLLSFKIFMCCAIFLCIFVSKMPVNAQTSDNKLVLKIDPSDEYPRNSEGSFVSLNNGTILFAYTQFYGDSTDFGKARIVAIESSDSGVTWSDKPRVMVEKWGKMNVMSVSLLRLQSGKIALFYLVKNGLHDCKPYVQISSDEAGSWSEPRLIVTPVGYFVLNNDRVVQLTNGRLIVPVAFHRPIYSDDEESADWRGITLWYLSDDEGQTWYESDFWWALPVPERRTGLQEPGVVELFDGTLFSWARTDVGIQYGFYSTNQGITFSPPQPTSLVSPRSPASIKRIPGTSNLLAVYNDHSGRFPFAEKKRNPLVVAISKDGGITWPIRKMIESDLDGHYCYTAVHFIDDAVFLAYCAGFYSKPDMGPLKPLGIRRLSIDWLLEEQTD